MLCLQIIKRLPSSAVLAHMILHERLHIFGMLGCVLCIVGSATIALHAPQEREINSVMEVWELATEPGTEFLFLFLFLAMVSSIVFNMYVRSPSTFLVVAFLLYATLVVAAVFVIIIRYIPQYGQTHIIAYIGVCSLMGSIAVSSLVLRT